jgi:hypothetical protein
VSVIVPVSVRGPVGAVWPKLAARELKSVRLTAPSPLKSPWPHTAPLCAPKFSASVLKSVRFTTPSRFASPPIWSARDQRSTSSCPRTHSRTPSSAVTWNVYASANSGWICPVQRTENVSLPICGCTGEAWPKSKSTAMSCRVMRSCARFASS